MIKLPTPIPSIEISRILQVPLHGDPDVWIDNIGSLQEYNEHSLVFSISETNAHAAGCIIAPVPDAKALSTIVTAHPKKAFRHVVQQCSLPSRDSQHTGIHATAEISPDAVLGKKVTIGAFSIIDAHVVLEEGSTIGSHCHIMHNVRIGTKSVIGHHSTLYPYVDIGNNVRIGAQCVLGDEGFGYEWNDTHWALMPQIANLIIKDNVTIGPMSVVDRGALDNTIIDSGSTLDAHMMLGHGVKIGKNVIMAACGAIGGSSQIGDFTIAGGCVHIVDHVAVAPQVRLAGGACVGTHLKHSGDYASSTPAIPAKQWRMWYRHMLRTISEDKK